MTAQDLPDIPFDDPPKVPAHVAVMAQIAKNGRHADELKALEAKKAPPLERFEDATPVKVERLPLPPPVSRANRTIAGQSGRTLPHSLEAEGGLLGSAFVDSDSVVQQALDAGIVSNSFYDSLNGLIFKVLVRLHLEKIPITTAIVAEELKKEDWPSDRNVYVKLVEVTDATSTTAQATYFIEKVREQAILREIIRTSTAVVEDAYDFKTGIRDFVEEIDQRMNWTERAGIQESILQRLEASRYNPARRLPDVAPVFYLGKVPVCTRGNISSVTAVTKVGKSSLLAGMLASTFIDPDHGGDTFTIKGLNTNSGAVIHFDTEQHGKDHEKMMDLVCRRAGADLPDWLHSYSRKGASAVSLKEELDALLKSKFKLHGSIHSVLLDGVADFAADVNDAKECNPLVAWLESLSVTYYCPIICVLHLNPTKEKDITQKSRGHLGSQLQRKVETDIRLKKEDEHTTVVYTDPQGTRRQPVFEKDGPRFKWDKDEQMHLTCRGSGGPRDEAKIDHLRELAIDAFAHAKATRLHYGPMIQAIQDSAAVSPKRAEARLSEMKKHGVLTKDTLGFWQVSPSA